MTKMRQSPAAREMTVFVAYATRYGATREVAEVVGRVVRASGREVEVRAAGEVATLDGCSAVVLGAPLYAGHWLEDAGRFLDRHREALTALPLAVFSLGPTGTEESEWDAVRTQLARELKRREWLRPLASALFGGRYDPAALDAQHRLLAAMPGNPLYGRPASDVRDWPAIEAWAGELSILLRRRSPSSAGWSRSG